jgi:hypothetical protein
MTLKATSSFTIATTNNINMASVRISEPGTTSASLIVYPVILYGNRKYTFYLRYFFMQCKATNGIRHINFSTYGDK